MTSPANALPDEDSQQLAPAWREQILATPPHALALMADIASQPLQALSDQFYAVLLDDPRASRFLSNEQVSEQLKPALQHWLRALMTATPATVQELIVVNRHIGRVHARVGIPVDLVTRGVRVLRLQLFRRIAGSGAVEPTCISAMACISIAMDIALEGMTLAYTTAHDRSARTDAAYRLFSLVQNVSTERERQRALLLDWENNLLYSLAGQTGSDIDTQRLSTSEFGLWYTHKGIPSFGDSSETQRITALIGEVDALLAVEPGAGGSGQGRLATLHAIRERLSAIRNLLNMLFERVGELDAGSDSLTNLLNRRFLPTVLRREIELASKASGSFAVLLLDLDHFKSINDRYGHETGDRTLQHVANTLNQFTRGSDYVFRLGGEEFVIVLVAVTEQRAQAIAESLRKQIAATQVPVTDAQVLAITASIGVAMYDGHPDYERLMSRADAAMYEAKANGRDQVVMARPGMKTSAPRRYLARD
ncbi:GGDEF domain-containing protein [Stenotrophomonas sp. MMGLT7]|uniref:GGDEF domain-containing protein n=1 Tax=Stenotrophomonas sp. MMGLT7 TaxID=2901227 RepID=UPI001E31B258|nr:GGDEF domain-containing protein [Stenotrophomonas sp. MMGLT7]MCD7100100.1 GGDEF domain-containing protein [Stenotrophomonas sp. MMGLT7]